MIDTNLLSLEFKSLADRHCIPLHERQIFNIMLDEIDRLRAELDRYKTSLDDAIFYGKPFAYWQELEAHTKELNYDTLVDAIVTLRYRLDRYRWLVGNNPEKEGNYQVTYELEIVAGEDYDRWVGEDTYASGRWTDKPKYASVIAYRPMPEAYSPDGDRKPEERK